MSRFSSLNSFFVMTAVGTPRFFRAYKGVSVWFIAQYQCHFVVSRFCEVTDDGLAVCSASGYEDCNVCHVKCVFKNFPRRYGF